jgi:hypothetical protein
MHRAKGGLPATLYRCAVADTNITTLPYCLLSHKYPHVSLIALWFSFAYTRYSCSCSHIREEVAIETYRI